jgi:putative DNA-invertase from lambdoid prophage Rac
LKPAFALLLALAFTANAETITGRVAGRPPCIDAKTSKLFVERLERGEAVAALAQEFGTSRQSIMRIRQTQTPSSVS